MLINRLINQYNSDCGWVWGINDGDDSNDDSNRNCSLDTPKSIYPPTSRILITRTSLWKDSSTSTIQIMVEYEKVDELVVAVVILIKKQAY